MTADDTTKQRAVLHLLRKGMVTFIEAAELANTSRQLVRYWAIAAGIDAAKARSKRLAALWRQTNQYLRRASD